jgi:hypothetical protein
VVILKKIGGWLLRASIAFVLCFVVFIAFYSGWVWWDLRQLRAFCAEVKIGARMETLPALADRHGINRRWIDRRVQQNDGVATIVPATSTMGDVRCVIHSDEKTVLSIEQPQDR